MSIPTNLSYTETHEWVCVLDDGRARVGLTDFAQKSLGDVVFVSLCEEGENLTVGASLGDVESIKAVSGIYSPLNGTVDKVNAEVTDSPELINQAPYDAWLVELSGDFDRSALLTAEKYREIIEKEN